MQSRNDTGSQIGAQPGLDSSYHGFPPSDGPRGNQAQQSGTSPTDEGDADVREAQALDIIESASLVADLRQELKLRRLMDPGPAAHFLDWAVELHDQRSRLESAAAGVFEIEIPPLPAAVAAVLGAGVVPAAGIVIDGDTTVGDLVDRYSRAELERMSEEVAQEVEALTAALDSPLLKGDDGLEEEFHAYGRALDSAGAPIEAAVVQALAAVAKAGVPAEERRDLRIVRNAKTGHADGTYENVYAACATPKLIGVHLGFDEFRDEVVISTDGGQNWRAMVDDDYVTIHRLLERARFKRVAHQTLRDVVHAVAKQVGRFDTAKLWLDRLQWDGVPRIERSLSTYFGAEDSDYTRAVGRYVWTAMAGRVLDPGCQADMVPVLVGGQGARKTSTVRAMVPAPEHFTEIDLSKRDNDLSRTMRGLLVGELGELRGLTTRDLEAVKTWVTQRWESWVPKYLEFAIKFPRRCVFIGTTNETEFLADSTGERRWLPVQVGNCDPDAVAADREELWAEAAAVWRVSGIAWQDAERLARAEHAKYKVHDAWGDSIAAWLDGCEGFNEQKRREQPFTTGQVMAGALGIAAAQQRMSDQKRVGKILQSMGFKRDEHQHRVDGQKARFWRPA